MNKQVKTIGLLAALTLSVEGAHADSSNHVQLLEKIQPGVYYKLTPAAAEALNIDLEALVAKAQLQNNQTMAFQATEDGEIDLAIYEQGVFSQLRADIVK